MRRNNWADVGACASVVRHPRTYREHAHRGIMLPPDYWVRGDTSDEAFWPTCRGRGPVLPVPIVNCQRCGLAIPMNSGWWCRHCHGVARWLQETRCMSMVQIAAGGEYDPPWGEEVQDAAPWMLWRRLELPRVRADEYEEPRPRPRRIEGKLNGGLSPKAADRPRGRTHPRNGGGGGKAGTENGAAGAPLHNSAPRAPLDGAQDAPLAKP